MRKSPRFHRSYDTGHKALCPVSKKAIGGKRKAKRRLKSLHFENYPATPRSHVRVE